MMPILTSAIEVVFWSSALGLLWSYIGYPLLLRLLSRNQSPNALLFGAKDEWPHVSVLMSVYNEEAVIEEKIRSLLALDYPKEKLDIYIGSDASGDGSNDIIASLAATDSRIHFSPFTERRGKPGVVNRLAEQALANRPADPEHIFLLTDANVMLAPQTLTALVRHFKNREIVLVDAHMMHTGLQAAGISRAEDRYISSEVMTKHREGLVWGKMIGPFGGCFALRSSHFNPIPPNRLVDDFYLAMRAFEQGGDAINDLDAVCHEGVGQEIRQEFGRKARISTGNFQNLRTFRRLWWPPFRPLSFAFFSHKVLRWCGPFFLIAMWLGSALLAVQGMEFYEWAFYGLLFLFLGIPLLDIALKSLGLNLLPLRALRYFLLMNAALLVGWFRYLRGVEAGTWEPARQA